MHDETFPAPLLPRVEHSTQARPANNGVILKLVVGGILSLLILALLIH